MAIIVNYRTPQVRDLAWACFSPPLLHIEQVADDETEVTGCALQLSSCRRLWLEGLDRDATSLLEHLSQRPTHRLGIYFEQLWHFFLQQDPDTELIAHNLPVHDKGRTVGEFDCIYYCHARNQYVHLELAVKYFLGVSRSKPGDTRGYAHEWLGPDCRDRLDLKLEQLLTRQILLGDNPAARQTLDALGVGSMAREIALKGYLFKPGSAAPPPPPGYNKDIALSDRVTCDQIQTGCNLPGARMYLVLPKMRWLSPARCDDTGESLTACALKDHLSQYFRHDTYPLLVAALDEFGVESGRFFVTPETWPASNQQY